MPCVLPGKLSLDHGTLAVAGCPGSQEGRCGEWPVLAHRLLGGGSSLSVSCPSLGSTLIATAPAHLWSSFRPLRMVSADWHQSSMWNFSTLPSAPLLLCSPPWLQSFPPCHPPSPPVKGLPSMWKLFLLHSSLPEGQVPSLFFCLCFFVFFCPTQVHGEFLAFWEV